MTRSDLIWAGNSFVDPLVCSICYQPECDQSNGGTRPEPGSNPSKLEPGKREYRGYCEWAVHPQEAIFILHRGYAIVDGQHVHVAFIHNETYVTQLFVEGSEPIYVLEEKFYGPVLKVEERDAVK